MLRPIPSSIGPTEVQGFDLDGAEGDSVRGSGHIGQHGIEGRVHVVGDVRPTPESHDGVVDLRGDDIGTLGQQVVAQQLADLLGRLCAIVDLV